MPFRFYHREYCEYWNSIKWSRKKRKKWFVSCISMNLNWKSCKFLCVCFCFNFLLGSSIKVCTLLRYTEVVYKSLYLGLLIRTMVFICFTWIIIRGNKLLELGLVEFNINMYVVRVHSYTSLFPIYMCDVRMFLHSFRAKEGTENDRLSPFYLGAWNMAFGTLIVTIWQFNIDEQIFFLVFSLAFLLS